MRDARGYSCCAPTPVRWCFCYLVLEGADEERQEAPRRLAVQQREQPQAPNAPVAQLRVVLAVVRRTNVR